MPRPRGQDLQEPAVRVLQRRPGNEVVGCRDENVGDVEVHPVGTAHLGRDDAMSLDASEDGAGLRFQVEVLASVRFCEGWTVLRPVDQVAGGRDGEARDAAVPLRVREHKGPVLCLDDARILDSPGPLVLPLRVEAEDRTFVLTYTQRSEEHTSELQSRQYLVCRLLLEK